MTKKLMTALEDIDVDDTLDQPTMSIQEYMAIANTLTISSEQEALVIDDMFDTVDEAISDATSLERIGEAMEADNFDHTDTSAILSISMENIHERLGVPVEAISGDKEIALEKVKDLASKVYKGTIAFIKAIFNKIVQFIDNLRRNTKRIDASLDDMSKRVKMMIRYKHFLKDGADKIEDSAIKSFSSAQKDIPAILVDVKNISGNTKEAIGALVDSTKGGKYTYDTLKAAADAMNSKFGLKKTNQAKAQLIAGGVPQWALGANAMSTTYMSNELGWGKRAFITIVIMDSKVSKVHITTSIMKHPKLEYSAATEIPTLSLTDMVNVIRNLKSTVSSVNDIHGTKSDLQKQAKTLQEDMKFKENFTGDDNVKIRVEIIRNFVKLSNSLSTSFTLHYMKALQVGTKYVAKSISQYEAPAADADAKRLEAPKKK